MTERKAGLPNPNNQEGSRENSSKKSKVAEILLTRSRVRGGILFVGGIGLIVAGRVLGEDSLSTAGATGGLIGGADLIAGEAAHPSKK
jgi:hypothetical protein